MSGSTHTPVLGTETVTVLELNGESVVVDATFGGGGHSASIIEQLEDGGILIGLDADARALEEGEEILEGARCTTHLIHENFRNIDSVLTELDIDTVDAILADLGWRTDQVVNTTASTGKGLSFQKDEPLLMTYGDPSSYPFTAHDIVNEWSEENIANILYGYGEERFARRIAKKIIEARAKAPIETTTKLVEIIKSAVPSFYRRKRIHPATKSFQALRIAVNDELAALEEFIEKSVDHLNEGGVLAIIAFHSIEDRIVKKRFRDLAHDHVGVISTKKPITPSKEEVEKNPRARSAKLRIFKRSPQEHHGNMH